MTTIKQPTLSQRATTESFLAAALAAVLLLVVLVWAQTWTPGAASAPAADLPIPTAQVQAAPPRPAQQPAATSVPDATPAPTPHAQIAPPQPTPQPAPTTWPERGLLTGQAPPARCDNKPVEASIELSER